VLGLVSRSLTTDNGLFSHMLSVCLAIDQDTRAHFVPVWYAATPPFSQQLAARRAFNQAETRLVQAVGRN
jgi:hypothetical protein